MKYSTVEAHLIATGSFFLRKMSVTTENAAFCTVTKLTPPAGHPDQNEKPRFPR